MTNFRTVTTPTQKGQRNLLRRAQIQEPPNTRQKVGATQYEIEQRQWLFTGR